MTPNIVSMTEEQATMRRVKILEEVGMSEEVLRARAAQYQLDIRQQTLFEELEDLDFLLAE